MKKLISAGLILLQISLGLFAQSKESNNTESEKNIAINPITGFPEISKKPFLMFNEGISFAQVNRIEKQKERSNFVRENYMIGTFFELQTVNMKPLESFLRVSAYYPFYNTFNGMQVVPKQLILYAFDIFYGPMLQTDMWKYVRLNFSAGPHYMYQLTDEYHMHYLGAGLLAGLELPVTRHWTSVINGFFTLDYPNLGTNSKVQPFDYSWQYHLEIGVRYSIKNPNRYSYIVRKNYEMINSGKIEDPYVIKAREAEAKNKAKKEKKALVKEKMKYMTRGEKAEYKLQLAEEAKLEKEAQKQLKLQRKQEMKEKRQKFIEERKQEKLKKAEEKKAKELEKQAKKEAELAEHLRKLEELRIRQEKEDAFLKAE